MTTLTDERSASAFERESGHPAQPTQVGTDGCQTPFGT